MCKWTTLGTSLLLLACVLCMPAHTIAQRSSEELLKQLEPTPLPFQPEDLDVATIPGAKILKHPVTGQWRTVMGKIKIENAGSQDEALQIFLTNYAVQLGLTPDHHELQLEKSWKSGPFKAFRFNQTYEGLLVEDAQIIIQIDESNNVTLVSNGIELVTTKVPLTKSNDSEKIIAIAIEKLRQQIKPKGLFKFSRFYAPKAEQVVNITNGVPRLIWIVPLVIDEPISASPAIRLDAQSLELLSASDRQNY